MAHAYKITVRRVEHNGQAKWRVRWTRPDGEDGKARVQRAHFDTEREARAQAAQIRGENLTLEAEWLAMPQKERERVLAVWREASAKGIDLFQALAAFADGQIAGARNHSKSLDVVLVEMLAAKKKGGLNVRYLKNLGLICQAFAKGRGFMPIERVSLMEVEGFLDGYNIRYRPTIRARLSALFRFAVRRRYRLDNPCANLEAIVVPYVPPTVLTVKQTAAALKYLKKHPKLLAWFVLSTFAGLRPDEARKSDWKAIHFKEGWIKVEAQTTKVRERRVVYPKAMAMKWLKRAQRLKSVLPVNGMLLRRERAGLKHVLGFSEWPQDVTRHSAASYWLAVEPDIKIVSRALGHSIKTLETHYLALVTKDEAEKFWDLAVGHRERVNRSAKKKS